MDGVDVLEDVALAGRGVGAVKAKFLILSWT